MPGYLVDEGGERTHAVLPIEEFEQLKKANEQLSAVRRYALDMVSVMDEPAEAASSSGSSSSSEESEPEQTENQNQEGYSWQR